MSTYWKHYSEMGGGWDFPARCLEYGHTVNSKDSPEISKLALMLAMMDEIEELKQRVADLESRTHYHHPE